MDFRKFLFFDLDFYKVYKKIKQKLCIQKFGDILKLQNILRHNIDFIEDIF